jgi:hypothetical protein
VSDGPGDGGLMEFETPQQLAGRLNLGREELCQRLLTSLILHAPYPRWNTRSPVSEPGLAFLERLWDLSGFGAWPGDEVRFVDEFELAPRHDGEKGGAPDQAVLWSDRVWMIELKTEVRSHLATQVPGYLELARYHFPDAAIGLTYLTPPMVYDYQPSEPWARYAHVSWPQVAPALREVWAAPESLGQRAVVDGLLRAIERMEEEPPTAFLAALGSGLAPAPPPVVDAIAVALELATATAEDGGQRALDHEVGDLEDLLELRLEVRDRLAASPDGSPLPRVQPWIWNAATTDGAALTDAGRRTGAELRLSRYRRARY